MAFAEYLTSDAQPLETDASIFPTDAQIKVALARHQDAMSRWTRARCDDRALYWREVEDAARQLRTLRAMHHANSHAVAILSAYGKLRSLSA